MHLIDVPGCGAIRTEVSGWDRGVCALGDTGCAPLGLGQGRQRRRGAFRQTRITLSRWTPVCTLVLSVSIHLLPFSLCLVSRFPSFPFSQPQVRGLSPSLATSHGQVNSLAPGRRETAFVPFPFVPSSPCITACSIAGSCSQSSLCQHCNLFHHFHAPAFLQPSIASLLRTLPSVPSRVCI